MRRARRLVITALAAAAAALVLPASALALAGGGSGGFGGGGGGGGGGFGGGGGGYGGGGGGVYFGGGGGTAGGLFSFILLAFILIIIVTALVGSRNKAMTGAWTRKGAQARDRATKEARERRAKEVHGAALVAAEDDPDFAEDVVVPRAEELFRGIQRAWDAGDLDTLETLVGADMMVEWRRRLNGLRARGWRNRVVVREVGAEYVGMTNLPDEAADRVVVRISAVVDDWVEDQYGNRTFHQGSSSAETWVREYWTLAMRDGKWTLLSIEQDAEGEHQLTAPLVAEQAADDAGLRDEAVVEQANADRAPAGADIAAMTPLEFHGDAMAAAREMALVDARFEPDVIEVAVRRALAAWAEAVDGADDALLAVSDQQVVDALLYGGDHSGRTRVVVRGPLLRSMRVTKVDGRATPPMVAVTAEVEGARYVEDRDTTTVLRGDATRRVRFDVELVLALGDDPENPWRLVVPGATATEEERWTTRR